MAVRTLGGNEESLVEHAGGRLQIVQPSKELVHDLDSQRGPFALRQRCDGGRRYACDMTREAVGRVGVSQRQAFGVQVRVEPLELSRQD